MAEPTVAILMCTRNSGRFLREQLDSLLSQTHANWELWISDDGSTDATRRIIASYRGCGKKITLLAGPGQGCTRNFLALTARPDLAADYFAWADADDLWLPDKLARAVAALAGQPAGRPALYGSRTLVVDAENRPLGLSPRSAERPAFGQLLAQNFAGGNTMLFNPAARDLLAAAGLPEVFAHDWWLGILTAGVGGTVLYDPAPGVRYRQHGGNAIGCRLGAWSRGKRFWGALRGGLRERNRRHIQALAARREFLTPENRACFDAFAAAHRAGRLGERARLLYGSGVRRRSGWENCGLAVLTLLGRYP